MKRRSLLKLGVASAVVLAVAGGAVATMSPGLVAGKLSAAGRQVFAAVGRGMLDGTLPADEGPKQIALNGLLDRVDALTLGLPPHAQDELSQLLGLLASGVGRRALAGLSPDWASATVPELQQAFQGMRVASLSLRQQAYHALHDITGSAYFADASAWKQIGYPGPLKI